MAKGQTRPVAFMCREDEEDLVALVKGSIVENLAEVL